jgi:heptosyltransferase-2
LSETNLKKPKVLLIRLSSLGDVVLATAAFAPLREAGYAVSLVTKAEFMPLFSGNPSLDQVYAFDKKKHGGEKGAREAFYAWASGQGFSAVLDLQNSWRTWSWRRRLSELGPVHALAKPRLREWLVIFLRLGRLIGFRAGGRAERFRKAAKAAVARWDGGRPPQGSAERLTQIECGEAERAKVAQMLPAGDFVALLPASAWKSKEWPYFPELARLLAAKVPVVVLGGPKDEICERVALAARAVNPSSCSLHGKTSLRESMAVLERARWVIGNDTGMVHVAEALGKDVAMIEGPTHSYMGFSPYRSGSALVGLDLVCRPCSKSGNICVRGGSRHCLYGLRVEQVASQLRERGYPC